MPLRNWFGVGVRLIGLWEIVEGLHELVTFGNVILKLYTPGFTSPNAYLTHAVAHLLIGFFLLFSAMSVVNAVYPPAEFIADEPPAPTQPRDDEAECADRPQSRITPPPGGARRSAL